MSSTPTTRNGFDKQAYGDNPDLWGIQNLNTDLDLIDESLDGITSVSTTGGTTTLSATNYATNEARKRILNVTGVLVSAATIVIPNVEKWYRVINGTSGAYTLTIKTSGGTGVTVTQGTTWDVHCDGSGSGTCYRDTMPPNLLPLASGTLDMNSNKITGLTAGSAASDAVRYDQLPGTPYYTDGGTKTAGFTAVANYEYVVDCTLNTITMTGFATPSVSNRLKVTKIGSFAFTWNLNGSKYYGSTTNPVTTSEGILEAVYGSSARGFVDL